MDTRTPPTCYKFYGFPIYYNIYSENKKLKLHLTYRPLKKSTKNGERAFGKIMFEQVHNLRTDISVEKNLECFAPLFLQKLFQASRDQQFLNKLVDPAIGLPLAVTWELNKSTLSKQWTPSYMMKMNSTMTRMIKYGWGATPIANLDPNYSFHQQKGGSYDSFKKILTLIKKLTALEVSQKRLTPPFKSKSASSSPPPKFDSTKYTNEHIRPDALDQDQVQKILDEMMECLSAKKDNAALALVLCLTMGLPLQEICELRWQDVECNNQSIPLTLHIGGTTKISNKRLTSVPYATESPKYRNLPIPTKVAMALTPLLEKLQNKYKEDMSYQTHYLIPNDKSPERKAIYKDLEKKINEMLRKKLSDRRFYDGSGKPINTRTPYKRCLATAEMTLTNAGFEEDEINYFFGRPATSTAGEFYCDFVNDAEQQRMRQILDNWLGLPLPSTPKKSVNLKNPAAYTELVFGVKEKTVSVTVDFDIPPVAEDLIPECGYLLEIWAIQGFSLAADVQWHGNFEK